MDKNTTKIYMYRAKLILLLSSRKLELRIIILFNSQNIPQILLVLENSDK